MPNLPLFFSPQVKNKPYKPIWHYVFILEKSAVAEKLFPDNNNTSVEITMFSSGLIINPFYYTRIF